MQFIAFLSAAAAAFATASADASVRSAVNLNSQCNQNLPYARIVNRCSYPVNIWSVLKGDGCPTNQMVTLNTGEAYAENFAPATSDGRGVSIKVSRTQECKGNDITQLEYFWDNRTTTSPDFRLNYLDVSYVDCADSNANCPTRQEGYYLQAGTAAARASRATTDNSWCPILSCSNAATCSTMSYVLPDDVQTKTCDLQSSMTFYMCGSEAPGASADKPASSAAAPASSSKQSAVSAPKPSTTLKPVVSSSANYKANVAAVTNAPEIKEAAPTPKIKTQVVYVTAYEYINAKRHEHGHAHAHAHARRHQPFNA